MSLPWSPTCQQTPGDRAPGQGNFKLRLPERTEPLLTYNKQASHPSPPAWQLLDPKIVSSARPQTTKNTTTYQYQHHDSSPEMRGKQGWSPPIARTGSAQLQTAGSCTSAQTSCLGAKCSPSEMNLADVFTGSSQGEAGEE